MTRRRRRPPLARRLVWALDLLRSLPRAKPRGRPRLAGLEQLFTAREPEGEVREAVNWLLDTEPSFWCRRSPAELQRMAVDLIRIRAVARARQYALRRV